MTWRSSTITEGGTVDRLQDGDEVVLAPVHPGRILREEFLEPYGLSANRLAQAIGVPANRITAILNGARGITGETAMLLGAAFGTTPDFWLNLQKRYELDSAEARVDAARLAGAEALFRTLQAGLGSGPR